MHSMQAFLLIFFHFPVILCLFIYSFGKKSPFVIYRKQTVMLPFIHKKPAAKLEPYC